ncbi:MAG: DnaJ domain-containing protein [Cyanobacteriota bacterium]|nr:DnaJ domain-containing protein [Cyanobacteriota bacterium]
MNDPYQILGVSHQADWAEIKAAFRRLAQRYHPDVAGQASEETFKTINAAYRLLIDPHQRQIWDEEHLVSSGIPRSSSRTNTSVGVRVTVQPRVEEPQPPPALEPQILKKIQIVREAMRNQKLMFAVHQAELLKQTYPDHPRVNHVLALAYYRLGHAFAQRRERKLAESYLEKAHLTDPDDLGLAFDIQRARALLERK